MSTLGVVVLSLKGMKHLDRCLESVSWADSVFVVHAGGGEPDLSATARPAAVYQTFPPAEGFHGLARKLATDWILSLWGEERVESTLGDELRALRAGEKAEAHSNYVIPVRSRLFDRWVMGGLWGPSPAPRLSRTLREPVPEWWDDREMPKAGTLRGWIEDYTLADLSDGMRLINGASIHWAEQLRQRRLQRGASALAPLRAFKRLFLANGFFSGGIAALTLSALAAYALFLSAAKMWEAENVARGTEAPMR